MFTGQRILRTIFISLVIVSLIIFKLFLSAIESVVAPSLECAEENKNCFKKRAEWFAYVYNLSEEMKIKYLKTIQKESNWQTSVYGDGGKAFGISQYWESTFRKHAKICGNFKANYKNPDDQLSLMACAFKKGYAKEWAAYRKLNQ